MFASSHANGRCVVRPVEVSVPARANYHGESMRRTRRPRARPPAPPPRFRTIPLVVLALTVVIVIGGVLLLLEWRHRSRTDEEKIRDTVEDFIDACIDEDFETVWDLHSTGIHETIAAQRKGLRDDLNDEEFFVENAKGLRAETGAEPPEDLSGWFPWALPPATLRSMTIRTVEIEPPPDETDVMVVLRPVGEEWPGGRRWRAEFCLKKEDDDWRLYLITFHFSEDLPAPPPPPAAETGKTKDGRASLTLGVVPGADPGSAAGHIAATGSTPADLVVVIRADRDARFRTLAPWLVEAARAGVPEIRIRADRRTVGTRGTTLWFTGLECGGLSLESGGGRECAVSIPDRIDVPDLLLEIGPDPLPPAESRGREGMFFRSILGYEEGLPLSRIPRLLDRPAVELAVVVAPRGDVSVQRVVYVGYALEVREYDIRPCLAVPDAVASSTSEASMLYNGLTPAEAADEALDTFPPVPPDHPALRRVVVRPR